MGITKLFNRKQKAEEKKAQEEKQAKYEAFIKEYKELAAKHNLDIKAILIADERGIIPQLKIIEIQNTPQDKAETGDKKEVIKENLEPKPE